MKWVVYGAGAIGAVLAARLSASGEDVTIIARGEHLAAIRERGLLLRSDVFGEMVCRAPATDDPAGVGPVDVVVLATKAHSLTAIAPILKPLLETGTIVVTIQNGLPWWYFHGVGGKWEGTPLESVDPGGVIAKHIAVERVIGALAYCSSSLVKPGVVDHLEGIRFPLGELNGQRTPRIQQLSRTLDVAGLKGPIRTDIRRDIWGKLMGNAPFNPISALTRATMEEMLRLPETRRLIISIMEEVRAVAAAVGSETGLTIEQRVAGAEQVGPHKTSMLQDFEAGRAPELEPIVGAVVEVADKAGVPVPNLRGVYGCAKLLFQQLRH
jgi:2-dehydropantoate 2-reductase